jgi:hypothetical protein
VGSGWPFPNAWAHPAALRHPLLAAEGRTVAAAGASRMFADGPDGWAVPEVSRGLGCGAARGLSLRRTGSSARGARGRTCTLPLSVARTYACARAGAGGACLIAMVGHIWRARGGRAGWSAMNVRACVRACVRVCV